MTNSPDGYTFIIKSRKLTPEAQKRYETDPSFAPVDRHFIDVETPYVVPNGKWVTEYSWGQLVGVDESEVTKVVLENRYGSTTARHSTLFVCDKPFGLVNSLVDDNLWTGRRVVQSQLTVARQIHKGEQGRYVQPLPVRYVRQAAHKPYKGMSARDNRRGNLGWVRLEWLAESACVSIRDAAQLVLDHWQFSGHLRYNDDFQVIGTYVDVTLAMLEYEVKLQHPEVKFATPEMFQQDAKDCPESLWISYGFAKTILRLLALGYKTESMQATA